MKIALIGYGKMGKAVEQHAIAKGHTIVATIDSKGSFEDLTAADICIDFTRPDCALNNIQKVAALKKNLIMGTTGWHDQLETARAIVKDASIGFLFAPNFSLGIALFLQMVEHAAKLIAPFNCYDVSGIEIHHNQKLDSPSGTAKNIIEKLQAHLPNNQVPIEFSSLRVGSVPGTHTTLFDSPADTITLTHTARNRDGFASGAIVAAEWLQGKTGFFTLSDMLLAKNPILT